MKKIIAFSLFAWPIYSTAQNTTKNVAACETCFKEVFLSVSQVTDVKSTDNFYTSLTVLKEKYTSIDLVPCNSNRFGGEQIFTNAMMVQVLNSTLEFMMDEILSLTLDKKDATKDKILLQVRPKQYDLYKHYFLGVDNIKDLEKSDCYYWRVQSLIERFGIDITNKQGLLDADKPVNGKNMALLLNQVFSLSAFNPEKYNKTIITKGAFVMMLQAAIEEYHKKIIEAAK